MISDKRGQGLSVNAIILIVLGVVVLAVLIFGFTVGFGGISPFVSGNNIDSIKTACNAACATNSEIGFCTTPREISLDDATLGAINSANPDMPALESGGTYNCQQLSEYNSLGIDGCSSVDCSPTGN
ncbi:MAG: hypothetical protein WDZ77_01040 [Candidatus Pacearchaeota archaeon]